MKDYEVGIISLCWLQAVKELGDWNGQCPPTAKHQKGKIITPKIKEVIGKVSTEVPSWVC